MTSLTKRERESLDELFAQISENSKQRVDWFEVVVGFFKKVFLIVRGVEIR